MEAAHPHHDRPRDPGFTMIELLIVIVILGVLGTVTSFAVSGITDKGEVASCQMDRKTLLNAAEYYLGKHRLDEIPATGTDADRFERTLIEEQFLREASSYHDLQADGTVLTNGSPCP